MENKNIRTKFLSRFNYITIAQALVFMVFMVLFFSMFYTTHRNILKKSYISNLMAIYAEEEGYVNNIINIMDMYALDSRFLDAVIYNEAELNAEEIKYVSERLVRVKEDNPMVENAFVINRSLRSVYGSMGVVGMSEFFSEACKYQNYSEGFWYNYKGVNSEHQILPPTIIYKRGLRETVIPIVFTKLDENPLKTNIVVNVSADKIFDNLEKNKLTANTKFLLMNKQRKEAYDRNGLVGENIGDEIYERGSYAGNVALDTQINNEIYMVVLHSSSQSVLGYTYGAFIPQKDIYNGVILNFILSTLLGIATVSLLIFLSKKNIEFINMRVKNAVDKIEHKENSELWENAHRDPISALNEIVNEINSKNSKYEQTIMNNMNIVERYRLITILNQNERCTNEMSEFLLKEELKGFKYNTFCATAVCMEFNEEFYSEYGGEKYGRIYDGVKDVIISMFAEKDIICYALPCDIEDVIYFIINMPEEQKEDLNQTLKDIKEIFKADREYVVFNLYNGGIQKGLGGLIKSHKRAKKELSLHIDTAKYKISLGVYDENSPGYFDEEKERRLVDLCISGKKEECIEFIEKLMNECAVQDISGNEMKSFLRKVLLLLFNIIRTKGIDFELPVHDVTYIESQIKSKPTETLDSIKSLLNIIEKAVNSELGTDIKMIIMYIDTHFNEENCTLTQVSQMFGISSKYLSNRFKDMTGTNFISYLTEKRISKAKELLEKTELDITAIGEKVGYPVPSTFIRAFKKAEGVSPKQYRNELEKMS